MSVQPISDNTDPRRPVQEKTQQKPSPREVADFHTNDDVDSRTQAHHHTLGSRHEQAAPGDHAHDGGTSTSQIIPLNGFNITGSRSSGAALNSIIAALVQLGAKNSTST